MPDPIDLQETTQWAIASIGGGGYVVGGSIFALVNLHTGRQATMFAVTTGITTELGVANASWPSWTSFNTSRPVNFTDFDVKGVRITYVSSILYGWTWLTVFDGPAYVAGVLASVYCPGFQIGIPGGQVAHGVTKLAYNTNAVPLDDLALIPDINIPVTEELDVPYQRSAQDDSLVIPLSADTLFDFDSAALKPQAEKSLLAVAAAIRSRPGHRVLVEGFTDSIGSDAYNLDLSERRAAGVKEWLVKHKIVRASNVEAWGQGKAYPVAPNTKPDGSDDPVGRSKNRRVEVLLRNR